VGKSLVTVSFSRDGELLTAGGDGTVRHWDLAASTWSTGRRVFHPKDVFQPRTRSTDGAGCVVRTEAGFVLQWVQAQQQLQVEWSALEDPATALAGGRSDARVVLATRSGRALVLDLKSGKHLSEFKGPDGKRRKLLEAGQLPPLPPIAAVAVESAGRLAASSWEDDSVDVWDIEAPQRGARTIPGTGRPVRALAFAPGGHQLAVAFQDGAVGLWDTQAEKWQPLAAEMVGPGRPLGLCYSPDGKTLVQTGYLTPPMVWDLAGGKHLPLQGHREEATGPEPQMVVVSGAAFSPEGKYGGWLATGGLDGTVRLWNARQNYQQAAVLSTVTITDYSPRENERFLRFPKDLLPAAGGALGPLPAPKPDRLQRGTWGGFREAILSVTFSPDGSQLIAVQLNGDIRVYDMETVLARLNRPAEDFLAETERQTGLRLQDDRPVPVPRLQLVREGESVR
jgi:WD40 repeat protein